MEGQWGCHEHKESNRVRGRQETRDRKKKENVGWDGGKAVMVITCTTNTQPTLSIEPFCRMMKDEVCSFCCSRSWITDHGSWTIHAWILVIQTCPQHLFFLVLKEGNAKWHHKQTKKQHQNVVHMGTKKKALTSCLSLRVNGSASLPSSSSSCRSCPSKDLTSWSSSRTDLLELPRRRWLWFDLTSDEYSSKKAGCPS